MDKRERSQTRGRETERAGRVVRRPITARQRAEITKAKPKRGCHDCVFYVSNLLLWMRTLLSGFPVMGMCANHAETPGQWREAPGRPCRNFRAKPRRVAPPEPPNDKIRYIPLTRGLHAIVDADDYEWLSQYKWYAGSPKSAVKIYARRYSPGGIVLMHREIMKPPKGMVVDHINGNGLDNRRCNLRICTQAENTRNRRKPACGQSRFIGVSPCGHKWQATVKRQYLGLFDDEVEAAKVRDRKASELYGEHAWLNFPPEEPLDEDA